MTTNIPNLLNHLQASGIAALNNPLFSVGSPFGISSLSSQSNNRLKVKRCRQRVDAGEPRNSYQSQLKLTLKREPHLPQGGTTSSFTSAISMVKEDLQPEDFSEGHDSEARHENWNAANSDDAENNEHNGSEYAELNGDADKTPLDLKLLVQDNGESRQSTNSAMSNSSSRRKQFQPQRKPAAEIVENGICEDGSDGDEQDLGPASLNTEPIVDEEDKEDEGRGSSEVLGDTLIASDHATDQQEVAEEDETSNTLPEHVFGATSGTLAAALAHSGNSQEFQKAFLGRLQEEAQRRWLGQQPKPLSNGIATASYEKSHAFTQLQQVQEREQQRSADTLCQSIKEKLSSAVNVVVDQLFAEYVSKEIAANTARMLAAATVAIQQQQQQAASDVQQQRNAAITPFMMPPIPTSLFGATAATNPMLSMQLSSASAMSNLFAAMHGGSVGAGSGSGPSVTTSNGIFPNPGQLPNPFGPFGGSPLLAATTGTTAGIRRCHDSSLDDGSPRKKRSKVTDSVRGPRATAVRDNGSSLPTSERSSPQSSYFPPTMVSHPLYNGATFGGDGRVDTPGNSGDENSEFGVGPFDYYQQSSTLTHVHLRKAKLMFFYTRYPSSSVLKSYFPDIHFNKNNTAQLVKWFSNFREFFYMQMEKFAKQAIAEGIRDKNDISVTADSEIYKQLNQHYNRNSVIEPPERLVFVVQETLREFFVALLAGRDAEPSWKKAIYKVIQQLDEPIPEYFKEGAFMETLERQ